MSKDGWDTASLIWMINSHLNRTALYLNNWTAFSNQTDLAEKQGFNILLVTFSIWVGRYVSMMDCTEIISVVTVPLNKRLSTWQILSTVVTFSCAALGFSPLSPHSLHLIWGHRFSNKTELDSIFISDKLGWQTGFQLILGDIFDLSWTIRLHAGLYRDNTGWSGSLRQRASYLRDPGHSCNIDWGCSVDFHPLDRRDFLASSGLVTNSIVFCWLFKIKDWCTKVHFQQTHNQGLRQLLLTVSWDLRA